MHALGRWLLGRLGMSTIVLTAVALAAQVRWHLSWWALATPVAAAAVVWVVAVSWDERTGPEAPAFARPRTAADARTLREDPNGQVFVDRGGFLFAQRHWFVGSGCPPVRVAGDLGDRQRHEPVKVAETETRSYWWFEDRFCWENQGLDARDVLALLRERERRRLRGLERAHTALKVETAGERRRAPIPNEVKRAVFERDGGRCVECGTTFGIQYDHVIPWSMGGADSVDNLQILCTACNQSKGATV